MPCLDGDLNLELDNEDIQHASDDLNTLDNVGLLLQAHLHVLLSNGHPRVQALQGGGVDVVEDLQRDDDTQVTQGLQPC